MLNSHANLKKNPAISCNTAKWMTPTRLPPPPFSLLARTLVHKAAHQSRRIKATPFFVLSTCWNALALGKLAAPAYLLKYFCIPEMIVQNWLLCSRRKRTASNTSLECFPPLDTPAKTAFFFSFFKTFHDDKSKHREVETLAHIWLLLINYYPIPPSERIFRNAVRLPGGPSLPFHLGQILLGLAKINRTMMIHPRQLPSLYHTPGHTFKCKTNKNKHLHNASYFLKSLSSEVSPAPQKRLSFFQVRAVSSCLQALENYQSKTNKLCVHQSARGRWCKKKTWKKVLEEDGS